LWQGCLTSAVCTQDDHRAARDELLELYTKAHRSYPSTNQPPRTDEPRAVAHGCTHAWGQTAVARVPVKYCEAVQDSAALGLLSVLTQCTLGTHKG
jgi:hypothetical protein